MTREEIVEGLKLLEDNMVYFDELQNDKGEWIDVHELIFEAISALKQEPCEDAVSREMVISKVKELFSMGECYCDEHAIVGMINEFPSVTQKSIECDDAVSRDAVLDIICRETEWYDIRTQIEQLPSVTQKLGHWIITPFSVTGRHYQCSECKYIHTFTKFEYCPRCGAEMFEPQESEDKE